MKLYTILILKKYVYIKTNKPFIYQYINVLEIE